MTWAEFVEAGRFGVPYPLADQRPYASGKELVAQGAGHGRATRDFCLVTVTGGQLLLTSASDSFLSRAHWHGGLATGWRPHDNRDSTVLIDPTVRFGRPAVGGISTEVIWEHSVDGEDDDEIAEVFGLAPQDVAWALAYEKPRRVQARQRVA